jgi:ER lumen protein retaining receptor
MKNATLLTILDAYVMALTSLYGKDPRVVGWDVLFQPNLCGSDPTCPTLSFLTRYLDLFWNFLSIYNWVMKVVFIISSLSIVYIIRFGVPHKETYNKEDDAFPTQYLLIPTLLLGIAVNQDHSSPFEMVWAFSIYLEAVAILPQLFMLQKQGGAESLTSHYVMLLGLYRLFYLFNWIYRYMTEDNYMQLIVWVAGIVQTALYLDFFYNYINAKQKGIDAPMELPA